ncbi:MAG TPA: CPBP family glutamic-type intramembrane protease, partial [Anaerolineales bacterium]|nr:CPBP family glutamic-type intramembrane protease [Anaerolineales bacterium]
LAIMGQGGPVQLHAANGNWKGMSRGILIGFFIGLPLAVFNVFALQFTQRQPIQWQHPPSALLDALQPGITEEVIYRFATWGLLWLVLRNDLPTQAVWVTGLLVTLIHGYAHFDDLFLQSPLTALGMGAIITLLWGLPPMLLARHQGLESAITFHWIQDVARFVAGF